MKNDAPTRESIAVDKYHKACEENARLRGEVRKYQNAMYAYMGIALVGFTLAVIVLVAS